MLWLLIRGASMKIFSWRNKKNTNTICWKRCLIKSYRLWSSLTTVVSVSSSSTTSRIAITHTTPTTTTSVPSVTAPESTTTSWVVSGLLVITAIGICATCKQQNKQCPVKCLHLNSYSLDQPAMYCFGHGWDTNYEILTFKALITTCIKLPWYYYSKCPKISNKIN